MPGEIIVLEHESAPGWHVSVEIDASGRTVGFAVTAPVDWGHWPPAAETARVLPEGGLTTKLIRSLPFAEIERHARYHSRRLRQIDASELSVVGQWLDENDNVISTQPLHDGGGPDGPRTKAAFDLAQNLSRHDRERDKYHVTHESTHVGWAKFAARYIELAKIGPAPRKVLAAEFGVGINAAKTRLNRAVVAGILKPHEDGKPRELTDYGLSLIEA
jgi:hypothetical protein